MPPPWRHVGQHGFEIGHQHAKQIHPDTAHVVDFLFGPFLFRQYPGLFLINILIGAIGQGHYLPHRLVEFALLVQIGDSVATGDKFLDKLLFSACRGKPVVKALAQKSGATAGDVHDLAHHV